MKKLVILVVLLMVSVSLVYAAKIVDVPSVSDQGELTEGDAPEPIVEQNLGVTRYTYAGNTLVASQHNGDTKYYHQDRLGSNRVVTDSSGNVDSEYLSLPFGQSVVDDVKYGFTGKELDSSGLHYFGARYYDSNLGRFSSVDPVADNHPYSYVRNNPLNRIDPSGMTDSPVERFGEGYFDELSSRVANSDNLDINTFGELAYGTAMNYGYSNQDELMGLMGNNPLVKAVGGAVVGTVYYLIGRNINLINKNNFRLRFNSNSIFNSISTRVFGVGLKADTTYNYNEKDYSSELSADIKKIGLGYSSNNDYSRGRLSYNGESFSTSLDQDSNGFYSTRSRLSFNSLYLGIGYNQRGNMESGLHSRSYDVSFSPGWLNLNYGRSTYGGDSYSAGINYGGFSGNIDRDMNYNVGYSGNGFFGNINQNKNFNLGYSHGGFSGSWGQFGDSSNFRLSYSSSL